MDVKTDTAQSDAEILVSKLIPFDGFDRAIFAQLLEDTNAETSLRIMARFYQSVEEAIVQIQNGLKNDDADSVWKACHKLAGSSELLGFYKFGQDSRKLNLDVKAMPDLDLHDQVLHQYLVQCEILLNEVNRSFPHRLNYL